MSPLAHRVGAEVRRRQAQRRPAAPSSPSRVPSSMYERSAASASSSSVPGEARARLDQREERARRDVEALERAPQVEPDLAHQPVAGVLLRGTGRTPRRRSARARPSAAPRARSPPRWCAGGGSGRRARGPGPAARTRAPAAVDAGGVGRRRRRSAPLTVISAMPRRRSMRAGRRARRRCGRRRPSAASGVSATPRGVGRPVAARRQLGRALPHGLLQPRARHDLVDQAPLHRALCP